MMNVIPGLMTWAALLYVLGRLHNDVDINIRQVVLVALLAVLAGANSMAAVRQVEEYFAVQRCEADAPRGAICKVVVQAVDETSSRQ